MNRREETTPPHASSSSDADDWGGTHTLGRRRCPRPCGGMSAPVTGASAGGGGRESFTKSTGPVAPAVAWSTAPPRGAVAAITAAAASARAAAIAAAAAAAAAAAGAERDSAGTGGGEPPQISSDAAIVDGPRVWPCAGCPPKPSDDALASSSNTRLAPMSWLSTAALATEQAEALSSASESPLPTSQSLSSETTDSGTYTDGLRRCTGRRTRGGTDGVSSPGPSPPPSVLDEEGVRVDVKERAGDEPLRQAAGVTGEWGGRPPERESLTGGLVAPPSPEFAPIAATVGGVGGDGEDAMGGVGEADTKLLNVCAVRW